MANPFLSPEFARIVASHRSGVRIARFEQDDAVVGYLAYEQSRDGGVARAIGSGFSDAQAIVGPSTALPSWSRFIRSAKIGLLEFDHLLGWQTQDGMHARPVASPVADLPGTYEDYEQARRALHRERFKGFDKKLRKFEREVGEVVFTFADDPVTSLEVLSQWKAAHYQRSGYPNIWNDSVYRNVVHDVATSSSPYCRGVVSSLVVDGYPAALQLSVQGKATLAGWITSYETELSRYSPGIELLRGILRSADSNEFSRYEFGKGDEAFKQLFKTTDIEVAAAWVAQPGLTAVLHRGRHAPLEHAEAFILAHPRLRARVRASLQSLGRARQARSN